MSGIAVEGVGSGYSREEFVSGLPLNRHSNGLRASVFVKSGPGALVGFTVLNTNASAQYIQWFDAQTLPADGAVPDGVVSVAGASDREFQWLPPRAARYGIVLCNSSTAGTKTIGSADCFFDVQFI